MSTLKDIWPKLARSKKYREEFVAAHAKQAIPFQIRALMKQFGLSQKELAKRCGLTQGAISRAADPSYGNLTINTLVRLAAGFDVAFVGRFVPFSDLPTWFDRLYEGEGFYVAPFTEEHAKRQALAETAALGGADLAEIPEASQPRIEAPEAESAVPVVQATSAFIDHVEQPRRDDERWKRLLDSIPVTMLKSELPEHRQGTLEGLGYGY